MAHLRYLLPIIEPSKAVKDRSVNPPTVPPPPYNKNPPIVYGIAGLGNTLLGYYGQWFGHGTLTFSAKWQRDGVDIPGATASTYLFSPPDEFFDITYRVTVTDSLGQSTSASSAPLTLQSLVQYADAQALHTLIHETMPELDNLISVELAEDLHDILLDLPSLY